MSGRIVTPKQPATLVWRWHAFKPHWAPKADFDAVYDWMHRHGSTDTATAEWDVAVWEYPDGHRVITYEALGGTYAEKVRHRPRDLPHKLTFVPLESGLPDVPRPDIPYLMDLQKTLDRYRRVRCPSPLLVIGDCLDEGHGGLLPGGAICGDTCYSESHTYAWPCPTAAEAPRRSEVELW